MKPFRQRIVTLLVASLLLATVKASPVPTAGGTADPNPDRLAGILDGLLNGSGSINDALGSLGPLLDNFSWDKFMTFACKAATAANDQAGSGDAANAKDIVCSIGSFFGQLEDVTKDNKATIDDLAKQLFSDKSIADLGGGFFSSEQLGQWNEAFQKALNSENPQDIVALTEEMYKQTAETENQNMQQQVAQGNPVASTIYSSPLLQFGEVQGFQERARYGMQAAETMANTKATLDIATAQTQSTYVETAGKSVKNAIAPAIQMEAQTAVSTRATVQEVVTALTAYMAQDSDQFSYLSTQLTMQSVQEVYTTHTLQITANAMLTEQTREVKRRQSAISTAIAYNTNNITGSAAKFGGVARSFSKLQGDHPPLPNIDFD
jgi:hypothetical protein